VAIQPLTIYAAGLVKKPCCALLTYVDAKSSDDEIRKFAVASHLFCSAEPNGTTERTPHESQK
jgi:hypothetical protein